MSGARPRENVRPDLPRSDVLLGAMMCQLGSTLMGGPGTFVHPSSLGCMETGWSGLPARELFLAAHEDRVDDLKDLLKDPKNRKMIHTFDNDGVSILHAYAFTRHGDEARGIINAVIDAGFDVNTKTKSTHEPPLQIAVMYGRVEVVAALLDRGARPDMTDWNGAAPLQTANTKCKHKGDGNEKCCKVLQLVEEATKRLKENKKVHIKAEQLRGKGNIAFQKGKFKKARELYTKSLGVWEDYRTFANRALCALKLGQKILAPEVAAGTKIYHEEIELWGEEAVSDAGKAISLEPTFAKAHYRQVIGYAMSLDFPRAKKFTIEALKKCPDNQELSNLLDTFNEWGVPDYISNRFSRAAEEARAQLSAGEPWESCHFCMCRIPVQHLLRDNDCPFCCMNFETYTHEDTLLSFILDH